MKRILLFDIDSTLTRAVYHRGRNPLVDALSELYGRNIEKRELLRNHSDCVFSGGTERSIIRDLLTANNVPYHDSLAEREKINELYKTRFEEALDRKDLEFKPLPGVLPLLEKCSKSSEVDLAIVTGNLLHCAELKLKSAGIDSELFKKTHEGSFKLIGGFGDDDIQRPGLVSAAISRFNLFYDVKISPDQFLVIGDTPKDIHCAHANDVAALGVATGIFGSHSLEKVSDSVLEDFQDLEKSFEILKTTKLRSDYKSFDYDLYCNIAADSKE